MQGEKINTWCGHGAIFAIDNVNYGFTGIFDGKGHTIYNANSNIFGKVSVDGVIKNLGIYTDNFGDYGALAAILSGTVENCYVRVSMLNQQPNVGAVCYRAIGAVSLSNVVVDVVEYDKMAWFNKGTANEKFIEGHVATFIFGAGSVPEVSNVFVVSPNKEDILCQNGSFKGTVNHYGREDEKSFATLSTASGYWTDKGDVKIFKSAIGWNLTKLGVVAKDDFDYNTNGELSWTAVPNASGYTVVVDGVEFSTGINSLDNVPNGAIVKVKACGNRTTFRDGEYSVEYTCVGVAEGSLAGFDHEVYEKLVEPDKTSGMYALQYQPQALGIEYLESYSGANGVLKVVNTLNQYGCGYFIINLPKAATGNKITIKMMVMDSPAGFKFRNIGAGSGDAPYIGGTSGQYSGNKDILYTKGAWMYLVLDISEQAYAGKDKFELAMWQGPQGASYTIYFDEVYDGEYSLKDKLASGLTGSKLADFSSADYEGMITTNTNSKAGSITTEYLDSYQGESGVLKVTITTSSSQWWYTGFVLNLVKNTTSNKVTIRMMKDGRIPGFKVQNADTGADLVNLTYETANSKLNQWFDLTVDLTSQTSKDKIAFHGWEDPAPAEAKTYTYYFAVICDGTSIA